MKVQELVTLLKKELGFRDVDLMSVVEQNSFLTRCWFDLAAAADDDANAGDEEEEVMEEEVVVGVVVGFAAGAAAAVNEDEEQAKNDSTKSSSSSFSVHSKIFVVQVQYPKCVFESVLNDDDVDADDFQQQVTVGSVMDDSFEQQVVKQQKYSAAQHVVVDLDSNSDSDSVTMIEIEIDVDVDDDDDVPLLV